jgi:hypothetical protein
MDLKNRGGKASAKSLIYMAENTGGEGGKAPAKSLKTRRRKAEKKSPLIVPPLRRAPGLPPGRAAGVSNLSVEQLVEQITEICARRRMHPFDANLGRQEMRLRSELRGLGFSERELGISPRQLGTNPRTLRSTRRRFGTGGDR